MKRIGIKTINVEELLETACNCCGKVCFDKNDPDVQTECLEIEKHWGYFSTKDGETHKWDICEKCYDEFVAGFKIPPRVRGLYD